MTAARRDEIAANLAAVEQRIAAACAEAGRNRDEITLIVITKTYPASDVELLASLGVTDVGENRHPEAGDKRDEVDPHLRSPKLRWHFVGGLQTNKANAVTRYADVIHSVDRIKLIGAIERGAATAGREVTCLAQIQLSQIGLSQDAGRSGAPAVEALSIAEAIAGSKHLVLGGVMAVAPLGEDPQTAFDELRAVSEAVREKYPQASAISAGMSGDLEQAVRAGATHLRIGRSVLGERPALG
ncbi:MAG: YggS family pyridoxal phosphate-dependent enzyme [Actinomycetota bacterium]|nr:YggS family pyridoxal phosphate-dependent enzyme [Actinomycetota bacterium]